MGSSRLLRGATETDAEAIASLFDRSYGDSRPTDADEVRSWLRNEETDPGEHDPFRHTVTASGFRET